MNVRDEPVEFWSDRMYRMAAFKAKKSVEKGLGEYDDLYQEGCLAVLLYQLKTGLDSVGSGKLFGLMGSRMYAFNERRREGDSLVVGYLERAASERADRETDPDAVLDVQEAVRSLPKPQESLVKARYFEFRSFEELFAAWGRWKAHNTRNAANSALRASLAGGYGPAVSRKRAAPPKPRMRQRVVTRAWRGAKASSWAKWGPIPNQRDDD